MVVTDLTGIKQLVGLSAATVPTFGALQVLGSPSSSIVNSNTLIPLGVVGLLLMVVLKVGRELEKLNQETERRKESDQRQKELEKEVEAMREEIAALKALANRE